MIPRKEILDMIEREAKKEKQSQTQKRYEDEVATSSLSTVLENIRNSKNTQPIRCQTQPQVQNLQAQTPRIQTQPQVQNLLTLTPRRELNQSNSMGQPISALSKNYFRARKLSNSNNSINNNQELEQSYDTPTPTSVTATATASMKKFTIQESLFSQSSKKNSIQSGGGTSKKVKSPMGSFQINSFTPVNINCNKNIIRGQTGHLRGSNSLSTFSSAFQAEQQNNNSNNNSGNLLIKNINLDSNISTPTNAQTNSTFLLSTPKSATFIPRKQSRSSYYTSKQVLVKNAVDKLPDLSLLQINEKQSIFQQIANSPKSEKIPLVFNNENNKSLNETQTIPFGQAINTSMQQDTMPFPSARSQSNPHSSAARDALILQRQSIAGLQKKNSIFDILYPDLVTQVNRQIGVLKTNQMSINSDVRQSLLRKPSINTLQFNLNKTSFSNQASNSHKKIKLQLNRTNSPARIHTPRKILTTEKEIKLQDESIESQQTLQDQQQNQLQQLIPQQQEKQKQHNEHMCITYKHLRLDKMFPESTRSAQTKQYFQEASKDFKAKIDFEKQQIKLRNQQVPYMEQIEQKINQMKYDYTKEQFNFVIKKNS